MPSTKNQKLEIERAEDNENSAAQSSEGEDAMDKASDDGASSDEGDSLDTDDEIAGAKPGKSKKTLKRKRRATEPSNFGFTLNALLNTDAPSSLPLSLKPSVSRKRNDEKLELKARKVLRGERKEKEDKGRIQDVIGGWGGEGERALRKVAQRGVVRLFNVIQQSQSSATVATEEAKKSRGTGKPSLPAPTFDKAQVNRKQKDNNLGRGKEAALGKDDFMDLIKSGVNVRV